MARSRFSVGLCIIFMANSTSSSSASPPLLLVAEPGLERDLGREPTRFLEPSREPGPLDRDR